MGRNKIDMTNKRFGKLTVIKDIGVRFGARLWLCRCDCGNTTKVIQGNLRPGVIKSCGCSRKHDIKGIRFGKLVALEDISSRDGNRIWKCVCDCGKTSNVEQGNLVSGNTKSCGCNRGGYNRRVIEINGIEKTMSQWAEYVGIHPSTLSWKINIKGLDPVEAVTFYMERSDK